MSGKVFALAQEAATIMDPVDPKIARDLRGGTTPESLLPIARRCLSKAGKKSRFDTLKVDSQSWDKLVDLHIACLKETLSLAYYMYDNKEKQKHFTPDRDLDLAALWEVWNALSEEDKKHALSVLNEQKKVA